MFKYTNTIVLNSLTDLTSGLPIYSTASDGSIEIKRVVKLKADNSIGPDGEDKLFSTVFRTAGRVGTKAKQSIDLTGIAKGFYRIKIYVQLSGMEDSMYANDFVFKGKPFYFEFEVADGEAEVAKKVAKLAKKFQSMYNTKYFDFSVDGEKLVIEGINEFQNITSFEVQIFDEESKRFVKSNLEVTKEEDAREAFGDYYHILKDLRLPTVENTSWTSINANEMPVPGTLYDQYVVHLRKNRGHVGGGGAVGEEIVSITTHVFYVKHGLTLTEGEQQKSIEDIFTSAGYEIKDATESKKKGVVRDNVAQVAAYSAPEQTTLELSETSITLSAEGEAKTITVDSDAAIVATPSKDWIKTTVLGNTVTVEVEANTTGKEYSGYVTITSNGKSVKLTVKQLAS